MTCIIWDEWSIINFLFNSLVSIKMTHSNSAFDCEGSKT